MKFIVFEGLDGAGKSTLIEATVAALKINNTQVVVTREPGGTPLGEEIRQILLRKSEHAPGPMAELLLYEAARSQHVERLIQPALNQGQWVLCDRFSASSVAFQSGGRRISKDQVEQLNEIATQGLKPDLYVLLDLTTEEAFRRMGGRELDRFESEKRDFHEGVRQSYIKQAQAEPSRWFVLDASLSPSELQQTFLKELRRRGWLSK